MEGGKALSHWLWCIFKRLDELWVMQGNLAFNQKMRHLCSRRVIKLP